MLVRGNVVCLNKVLHAHHKGLELKMHRFLGNNMAVSLICGERRDPELINEDGERALTTLGMQL